MKTCPKCNQDYNDETLNYCLIDGSILSDETPTVIKSVPRSEKKLFNLKTFLVIFIVLAIPVTLIRPYNWGEERLLTDLDKNTKVYEGSSGFIVKAVDVLPIRNRELVFDSDKRAFSIDWLLKDKGLSHEWNIYLDESPQKIVLQRKLIVEEWILMYILALIIAFFISIVFQKVISLRVRKKRQ